MLIKALGYQARQKIETLFAAKKGLKAVPLAHRASAGELVIGAPGMGKTRYLMSRIQQAIRSGKFGLLIVDIHGDLFWDTLHFIAELMIHQPEIAERVVIIDPTNPDWVTARFNPLAAVDGRSDRYANFLADILLTIWKVDVSSSPRMTHLLGRSLLALSELGLNLADLPRFLQDDTWRNGLLQDVSPEVRNFFLYTFPRSDSEKRVWISPVLNKLKIVEDPDIAVMLTGKPKLNFRQAHDQQLITLVHAPKGILGELNAETLCGFIIAQNQKAVLSRANMPDHLRKEILFILDEFQNYSTPTIASILSESRKFHLGIVMAHQYLDQLSAEMTSAVINTTKAITCLRVGYKDARRLVSDIFPYPDFLVDQGITGWDGLALELANLSPRIFWHRQKGIYLPTKKRTIDVPDIKVTPQTQENLAKLIEISSQKYGGHKAEALAEMQSYQPPAPLTKNQKRRVRRKRQKQQEMLQADGSATLDDNAQSTDQPDNLSTEKIKGEDESDLWN